MQADGDSGESYAKKISPKMISRGIDGVRIKVGDEKFDLILNIMVGIKKSIVNLIEIAPHLPLTDHHFVVKLKTEN